MFYLWLCVSAILATQAQERHHHQQQQHEIAPDIAWSPLLESTAPMSGSLGSELIGGQPIYMSMTTIHSRLYGIVLTIESIFTGTIKPDRLFVMLSNSSFLLDHGVSADDIRQHEIAKLVDKYPISIVFTDNIGPHRKLLPLLAQKWTEDCVIITVDDHEIYPRSMLESLLKFYLVSKMKSVVSLRARRMGICSQMPWKLSPYSHKRRGLWPEMSPGKREMLVLPTGTAGVLYRPRFFDPVVFDRDLLNATVTGDDLLFRLATLARGVKVVTACVLEEFGGTCSESLDPSFERKLNSYFDTATKTTNDTITDLTQYNYIMDKSQENKLHRRRSLKGAGKKAVDPRKEVSLASKFNAGGGNNKMWADAVALLQDKGVVDFTAELQRYAPNERKHCVKYMSQSGGGFLGLGTLIETVLVSYQGMYDKECGIWSC